MPCGGNRLKRDRGALCRQLTHGEGERASRGGNRHEEGGGVSVCFVEAPGQRGCVGPVGAAGTVGEWECASWRQQARKRRGGCVPCRGSRPRVHACLTQEGEAIGEVAVERVG